MRIFIVTSNTKKYIEMQNILHRFSIEAVRVDVDLFEPQSLSAQEIVTAKAREAFAKVQGPVIVDDSGFYVEKYNRFPGTLSKYVFRGVGYQGLFSLFAENDRAHFECSVAYMDGTLSEPKVFTGTYAGKITEQCPRDPNEEMPYAPLFIPDDSARGVAMAEMTEDERSHDHRHQALEACARFVLKYPQK
ncbi:MAG: hypothetical protein KIH62_005240 [Candidatus Kerfeldbacteria bacterium]|nr:hypothetical protein [Candidatus Kerfeldbacteria bacterium]